MKKWGLPLLLLGACLYGCQETQPTTDGGQAETEIADHASQTAQTDQDANSAATSEKNPEPEKTSQPTEEGEANALWTPEKEAALADFMGKWSQEMGEKVEQGQVDAPANFYGLKAPNDLFKPERLVPAAEPENFRQLDPTDELLQPLDLVWSKDGLELGKNRLLATYVTTKPYQGEGEGLPEIYLYLFILDAKDLPHVLVTSQSQGGYPHDYLLFYETENTALQEEFVSLFTKARADE